VEEGGGKRPVNTPYWPRQLGTASALPAASAGDMYKVLPPSASFGESYKRQRLHALLLTNLMTNARSEDHGENAGDASAAGRPGMSPLAATVVLLLVLVQESDGAQTYVWCRRCGCGCG